MVEQVMSVLTERSNVLNRDSRLTVFGEDVAADLNPRAEHYATIKNYAGPVIVMDCVPPDMDTPGVIDDNRSVTGSVVDKVLPDDVPCKISLAVVITICVTVLIVFPPHFAFLTTWAGDGLAIIDDIKPSSSGIVNNVVFNEAVKGVFHFYPGFPTVVKMIASDHMSPFHSSEAVGVDAHPFRVITDVVDVIVFKDIVMGSVHAPYASVIEVVDVVISEDVVVADVV